jgi:phage terminase large subunit GpA-like protein
MIPGDVYTGWVCKNKSCGLVIAIAPTATGSEPAAAAADDRLTVIKCPHCGDEDLYRWSARGEHPYTAGTAST